MTCNLNQLLLLMIDDLCLLERQAADSHSSAGLPQRPDTFQKRRNPLLPHPHRPTGIDSRRAPVQTTEYSALDRMPNPRDDAKEQCRDSIRILPFV
jgi:hypothetical protein